MAETYKKLAQRLDEEGNPIGEQEFEISRTQPAIKEVMSLKRVNAQIDLLQAEITKWQDIKTSLTAL